MTTIVDTRPRTCAKVPFAVSRAAPDAARRPMSRVLSAGSVCPSEASVRRVPAKRAMSMTIVVAASRTACLNGWSCPSHLGRSRLLSGLSVDVAARTQREHRPYGRLALSVRNAASAI